MPLVKQKLLTMQENLSSSPFFSNSIFSYL